MTMPKIGNPWKFREVAYNEYVKKHLKEKYYGAPESWVAFKLRKGW